METDAQITSAPNPKLRWYQPTPGHLLLLLLLIEASLIFSERWFPKGLAVLATVATVGVYLLVMLLWLSFALLYRWRFQFSIRSLLLLTFAVAVPCSWLAVEMNAAKEQKAKVKLANTLDYDYAENGAASLIRAWMQNLLGEDFFGNPICIDLSSLDDVGLERLEGLNQLLELSMQCSEVKDAELEHLKGLSRLNTLNLGNTPVTDVGLENLKGLSQLKQLYIDRTQITDAGLKHLKGLNQLETLYMNVTQVTDAGLENLKGLSQLKALNLDSTRVSNAGLDHLKGLNQLRFLFLVHTPVTDEGIKKLQQALPECTITNRSHPD